MKTNKLLFNFPGPQIKGTFLSRPQRFLAEVVLQDGTKTLSYYPNPGALNGCLKAGSSVLLWDSTNSKRKRRYTLRAIKHKNIWIGTDTHLSNHIAEKALLQNILPKLRTYKTIEREHSLGLGQRIDFFLKGPRRNCFLEVKSSTIVHENIARFPDSVTPRSLKHLQGLCLKAKAGHRAILLFVIQRGDAVGFTVNHEHYPDYALVYKQACNSGVEVYALVINVRAKGFYNPRLVPIME